MRNLIKKSILILSTILVNNAWALSPPNPTADTVWTDTGGVFDTGTRTFTATFNGVVDIAAAFNNGRRQEEAQLNLTVNSLGNLVLPAQTVWDTMTDDAKGLFILNAERVARAGMLANVIGLPLAGIESHMDNISKNYGDILHDSNTTGHNQPSGNDSLHGATFRIEQDADIGSLHRTSIQYTTGTSPAHTGGGQHSYGDTFGGLGACHEFITRSENLAFFATGGNSIPLPVERAIYTFIYNDAGEQWGHREAALLQDETLSQVGNGWGFSNNNGNTGHEGYLGIYVRGSATYKPVPNFNSNFGTVVVMNIFDPVGTPTACPYNVSLDSANTTNAQGKVPTFNVANNQWIQIGLNTQPATGSTVADILGDDIDGTYGTNWVVFAFNTATNAYQQLNLTDAMLPGIGYWLIQVTGNSVTIDMPGSSSGVHVTSTTPCTSTQGCFEVTLQPNANANQWQMVGYPFRDNRSVDSVRIVTNTGTCSTGCNLTEANTAGIVASTFWRYNGTAYDQLTTGGNQTLVPWNGLWISILSTANGTAPKVLFPATN